VQYRELGNLGIDVSEIGFGTWGLGGNSYGPVDDQVSKTTLQLAYDNGITFYDTSDLYGNGHSEEILGETFKGLRDKVIIATKVGTLPHSGFRMPQDFSPRYIRKGIEASLKRLRTDYIDLYQLHSPSRDLLENGDCGLETLRMLQKEGKIRTFGISVRSPDDGLTAIEKFNFPVVQVNFNLIDHRAIENGLLEMAKRRNTGVIARTPLCFGYLSGKLTGNDKFKGLDHRMNWPKEQLRRWASAPNLFSFLNQGKGCTPAQLALRFCLDQESISTVIPGMMNEEEVKENIKTIKMDPLSEEEISEIRLVYKSNIFYDPSAK
jgi:aryl-alcohol dehydrogenase-like predicted oxidoreductase